jgi:hypothetical protein
MYVCIYIDIDIDIDIDIEIYIYIYIYIYVYIYFYIYIYITYLDIYVFEALLFACMRCCVWHSTRPYLYIALITCIPSLIYV